ncbi:hypothetical protein [Chryseobacterium koreense]|nr:hypothetical protein [Chryseobacterium koreense]MBB5332320.1 hypothetical protein [Chryseobacterium koreense]
MTDQFLKSPIFALSKSAKQNLMALELYNPFDELIFDESFCFLTGKLSLESVSVFPEWLLDHFKIGDDPFEMMEKEKIFRYRDLRLPCTSEVKNAFDQLDEKFREAYQKGYEGIAALEEELIFQWSAKIVYGIMHHEFQHEKKRMARRGEEFQISKDLKERFGLFHLMLQSVIKPVKFKGRKPWSLVVFPLKYSADIFSYRDDMINLLFTMGVDQFGFIIHMQDNGAIAEREQELLEKMKGYVLHPVQYEELYAKFHYSDYLLQYRPKYNIEFTDNQVIIESVPMSADQNRPLFGFWDQKVYAQLLANYWEVYGIRQEDIIRHQRPMLSFLQDPYSHDFIDPEKIDLPF